MINTEARQHQSDAPEAELLQNIFSRLNIQQWDLFLVGDGSGSGWDGPCGWSTILIDRLSRMRQVFYGGANLGSVNFAEAIPYAQALSWYDQNCGKNTLRNTGSLQVHILTDSQTLAQWGTKAVTPGADLPRKGLAACAMFREFHRLGYRLHFHWAPRCTTQLNYLSDCVAGLSRRVVKGATVENNQELAALAARVTEVFPRDPETGELLNIYHLNPETIHACE